LSKLVLPNDTLQHSNEAVTLLAGGDTTFYFSQEVAPPQKIAEFHLFYSQKKKQQEVKIPFPKELIPDRLLFMDAEAKTLYLNCAVNKDDIYFSKQIGGKWQKPLPFNALNSLFRESGMCISPDKKRIIFASSRNANGPSNLDLYCIDYQEDGMWRKPTLLSPALTSDQDEDDPVLSADGKTLYFASKGFDSKGNFDLFRSTFDETNSTWSPPINLGAGINSEFNEISPALNSKSELTLFCSDRYSKPGDYDIYKPVQETKVLLNIQVNNEDSSLQIGNLQVRLLPEDALPKDGSREVTSETGIYVDSIFLNRKYTLQIMDRKELLVSDHLFLGPNSIPSRSYLISLSKIKTPYLIYKGKKIPLLTKYTLRYENEELLPIKNNEKTLERVAELLGHLHIYHVEIQYPSNLTKGSDRIDKLRAYLLKKGASSKDLLLSKQSPGNSDEVLLRMEFKTNVH
jgi:hypothetical protein